MKEADRITSSQRYQFSKLNCERITKKKTIERNWNWLNGVVESMPNSFVQTMQSRIVCHRTKEFQRSANLSIECDEIIWILKMFCIRSHRYFTINFNLFGSLLHFSLDFLHSIDNFVANRLSVIVKSNKRNVCDRFSCEFEFVSHFFFFLFCFLLH